MKHKLSEIIHTDCYVQFDSNEQLREWVKITRLTMWAGVFNNELFIFLPSDGDPFSIYDTIADYPIHHHTNIEI